MVFVGVIQAPQGNWPNPPYTEVDATPIVREKPFLEVDAKGNWNVRISALRKNSIGITWHGGSTPGRSISLNQFYIAHPDRDTAASINAELARGKDLLFTPGVYALTEPIRVTRANTVVMGIGFPTLKPIEGKAAMVTADADGIIIAGLLFDAGEKMSPVLLEVGPDASKGGHRNNPISLHDVFFRVGGASAGRTGTNLVINSSDTIVDHTWIWRADHGKSVGWDSNISENGLVVNADGVTAYGLFVEHHRQFQVLWNGNGGRTFFYQSEIPYDPPTQASYSSAPDVKGWASYKVANTVTNHEAWGLGIYSVFLKPDVVLSHAIEAPTLPSIRFHHMITVALGDLGKIENVINDKGGSTSIHPRITPMLTAYPSNTQ
jgi:hypothetical protein